MDKPPASAVQPACERCEGRGWIMGGFSRDIGGGLGAGGSWNEPCPVCHPAKLPASAVSPTQPIEHFWTAVSRGWDIEPREYFEREAVPMGFKSPVEMAVHWMWKRHAKDWPNAELKEKQASAVVSPREEPATFPKMNSAARQAWDAGFEAGKASALRSPAAQELQSDGRCWEHRPGRLGGHARRCIRETGHEGEHIDAEKVYWTTSQSLSPAPAPLKERADAAQGGVHIDTDGSMFYDNVPRVEESDK